MSSRRRLHPLTMLGLLALVAGSAVRLFGHWHGDAADATLGFLYGASIALMLFGIYRTKRAKTSA